MNLQKRHGDLMLGLIMLAFGAVYLIGCTQIVTKTTDAVGSAFVPYILGGLLLVLGVIQILRGLAGMKKANADSTPMGKDVDFKTVGITLALLVAYIALLSTLGFIISTALYLFFQFLVLTPDEKQKRPVRYGVIAVITGVGVFLLFRYGLHLMLPQGLIKFI